MSAKGCATSLGVANRCADGVMSESQPDGPGRTGPNASANWPMSLIPTPRAFVWCSIISTPIQERPDMRRFRQRKPDGYWTVWSFTTPPSMPVGSTWRKSTSAFYRVNASIAVWTTPIGCAARSAPGKNGATNDRSKSIGVLPLLLLGINSTNSIRSLTTVNHPGEKEPVNRRLSTY